MYEIKLTISHKNADWAATNESALASLVDSVDGSIAVIEDDFRRITVVRGSDKAAPKLESAVKNYLAETYCTVFKRRFLLGKLRLPMLNDATREVLIRTLIAFDRERDAEYVRDSLVLSDEFSLEGFYDFRLRELAERWLEITRLTEDNNILLYDERALNLLLRFLLSAVEPKFECVRVAQRGDGYVVKTSKSVYESTYIDSATDLLLYLIDVAPMQIILENKFSDGDFALKLSNIFDVKDENNTLTFGEILR